MPRLAFLASALSLAALAGCGSPLRTAHISAEELRERLSPATAQTAENNYHAEHKAAENNYHAEHNLPKAHNYSNDEFFSHRLGSRAFEYSPPPPVETYIWHTFKELYLKQHEPEDLLYRPAQTALIAEETIKKYTNFNLGTWKFRIKLSPNSLGFVFSRPF